MDIGFIGLGKMGRGMAQNLLQADHTVTVWNRTASRADELQKLGAQVAASPAEAARAGIVITMLADDAALESAVFGENGILKALPSGGLHVSMSTISVALSTRLTAAHIAAKQAYVAAPVFGRPEAATAKKLFIVAAGSAADLSRSQPIFDALGQRTYIAGNEPHAANTIKLLGNFLIATTIESFGEAFALARKSGIAPEKFLEIITGTLFTAPLHQNYGGIIARQAYEPAGFAAALGLKDARLVLQAADAAGVPLPIASLVRDRFLSAIGHGHAEKDWSIIAKLAAEDAGLK
jgi:3-hydroxyisobutyrate dehydrogenase-like beta-hydroxyacid dehydrogenase